MPLRNPITAAGPASLLLLLCATSPLAAQAVPTRAAPLSNCPLAEPATRFSPALSVSLTWIDDYPQTPAISQSPDRRWAAWITHCGDAAAKVNRYTLWVFDLETVRSAMASGGPPPAPAFAVTRASRQSQKAISHLQWAGSDGLLYIATGARDEHRVERLDLASGRTGVLAGASRPILAYQPTATGLVYAAARQGSPTAEQTRNGYIPPDVYLLGTLGVNEPLSRFQDAVDFYLARPDRPPAKLAGVDDAIPFDFPGISISPDGRYAVMALPAANPPGKWRDYIVDSSILRARLDNLTDLSQLQILDLTSGSRRPLIDAPSGTMLGYSLPAGPVVWAPDSRSLIAKATGLPLEGVTGAELDHRRRAPSVVEFDVPSLRYRRIADLPVAFLTQAPPAGAERRPRSIDVDADGRRVSFERRNETGTIGLASYEKRGNSWTASAHPAPAQEQPGLQIVVRQSLNGPPTIVAVDVDSKRELLLQDLNPVLATIDAGRVEVFEWKDSRGRAFRGGLVHPPGPRPGRPLPLVVQFYGFEEDRYLADGTLRTAFAARSMAARNMYVLQLPLPPGGQTADEGPSNLAMLTAAIDALAKHAPIDRSRVGLVGFSQTCYPVKYAISHAPEVFRAAVVADGRDNGFFMYLTNHHEGSGGKTMERYFQDYFGTSPYTAQGLARWRELAPVLQSANVRAAVLTQAIRKVSAINQWEMHAALRKSHVPADMVYFPEGDHELDQPEDRLLSMQSTADWMSFWLADDEDLPSVPAATLKHWRDMRAEQRATLAAAAAAPASGGR